MQPLMCVAHVLASLPPLPPTTESLPQVEAPMTLHFTAYIVENEFHCVAKLRIFHLSEIKRYECWRSCKAISRWVKKYTDMIPCTETRLLFVVF